VAVLRLVGHTEGLVQFRDDAGIDLGCGQGDGHGVLLALVADVRGPGQRLVVRYETIHVEGGHGQRLQLPIVGLHIRRIRVRQIGDASPCVVVYDVGHEHAQGAEGTGPWWHDDPRDAQLSSRIGCDDAARATE
jgi:hypothetical protein